MGRVYALSRRTVTHLAAPEVAPGCIRATRAAPIVLRDRVASLKQATWGETFKRKRTTPLEVLSRHVRFTRTRLRIRQYQTNPRVPRQELALALTLGLPSHLELYNLKGR